MSVEMKASGEDVALFVPTYKDSESVHEFVHRLQAQDWLPKRIEFWDSSPSDETYNLLLDAGQRVRKLNPQSFNHGSTRQEALEHMSGYAKYVVFMSQDAFLNDSLALASLCAPFGQFNNIGAVFGRQVAKPGHPAHVRAARERSYPDSEMVVVDSPARQPYFSNAFAAYDVAKAKAVGGFPMCSFGEDAALALRLLRAGHRVVYEPAATVEHSHDYSMRESYSRGKGIGRMLRMLRAEGRLEVEGANARTAWEIAQRAAQLGGPQAAVKALAITAATYAGSCVTGD